MIGSIGGPELLLILILALIVFGPRKLPEIGKSLGKMMVEFRRAGTDFKRTIEEEVDAEKLKAELQVPLLTGPEAPAPRPEPIPPAAATAGEPSAGSASEPVTPTADPADPATAAAEPTPGDDPASQAR
jgi:sec-independent protein translocase protein TatB